MTKVSNLSAEVGYQIHTNRELGLMLRGVKPLAVFMYCEGHFPPCISRYLRMFDRHVAAGRISRRVYSEEVGGGRVKLTSVSIFYALPSQEWRIDAMRDLRSLPGEWTDERTRREGELLGYTDEQNDIWLARVGKWRQNS